MSNVISNILPKLYWPLIVIYSVVLLSFIILYFTELNNWSDRNYYNWMNFKRIFTTAFILFCSLIMKYKGNEKVSNLILYIPTGITLLIIIFGIFMMYMFSKSNG
ncbi:MAG: hypothetical protein IPM42_13570 [Saprospiraceae bacterium]|nr:hypothetical protein [Saprospiraceae bacterium]